MNWDDPAERAALIERTGPEEYNRMFKKHLEDSTLKTVAGHAIRPVNTRFGKLFSVGGTGLAFLDQQQAEEYAKEHPV